MKIQRKNLYLVNRHIDLLYNKLIRFDFRFLAVSISVMQYLTVFSVVVFSC